MKVLQLGKFYPPTYGGIETVTYDIVEYLNQHHIQTDVLCSNESKFYKEDSLHGYKVMRTKSFGVVASTSISPQMIIKLKSIMAEYDILHVHLPNPLATLALYLTKPKQKIVLHWHSDIIKQKFLLKLYEPLQSWTLKRANKIIATSPEYMNTSSALAPYLNKSIAIPLGIDKEKQQYKQDDVQQIKEEYKNKKIIFSLGRMTYYKGFEYLIEAGKYLNNTYVILIGGDGELLEYYKQKIIDEKLENRVHLLGKIEDKKLGNYFQACDLFCLPSIAKSEAFGIVQIEAMSYGKPIVATNIKGSGVNWVNKQNVSGLNVPIKNAEALANAFNTLLSDSAVYQKYAKGAKNRFEIHFTREVMGQSIMKVYKEL